MSQAARTKYVQIKWRGPDGDIYMIHGNVPASSEPNVLHIFNMYGPVGHDWYNALPEESKNAIKARLLAATWPTTED